MTPSDAARLLAKAAAFDLRTVGQADALAWHEAIGDLDYADAMAAVSRYYSTATDDRRIMPGHVRALVGEIQRERRRAEREARERAAIEAAPPVDDRPLRDRSADLIALVDSVQDVTGPGRPEELSYGRKLRSKRPMATGDPNPEYAPTAPRQREWQASPRKAEPCWWEDERARERHANELLADMGRLTSKGGDQ